MGSQYVASQRYYIKGEISNTPYNSGVPTDLLSRWFFTRLLACEVRVLSDRASASPVARIEGAYSKVEFATLLSMSTLGSVEGEKRNQHPSRHFSKDKSHVSQVIKDYYFESFGSQRKARGCKSTGGSRGREWTGWTRDTRGYVRSMQCSIDQ